ncbi:MAG: tetraacyldisaccharide 4'-kinase [Gemmatimonadota bacterium]|nr:tetraacyldisaccharide 4'-kinase [Gemmatimonadota bacterium]
MVGGAWRVIASPLAWMWENAARRRLESTDRAVRLSAPVVSVGNVTVGGSGKTSLVRWLVETGVPKGEAVAVLTRGYGRRDEDLRVLRPGGGPPEGPAPSASELARLAGDEPMLLSRAGAWVGVGQDRSAGARAVSRFVDPDLFVLDDGLQHRAIARSLDLVVFTKSDLHAPARCLPSGPLRQGPDWRPPEAAWVVAGPDPRETAMRPGTIGDAFRGWWSALPGTTGRWVDLGTATLGSWHAGPIEAMEPGARPAVAFAGVGRPEGVVEFAARAGFEVDRVHAFPDHHLYHPGDARELVERHPDRILLTTEKDAVKLEPGWFGDHPVGVLRRGLEIEEPDLLRDLVARARGREA